MSETPARSAVEDVKDASNHLRGTLAEELGDGTDRFSADSTHLLKFHGIYQQDDRDKRRARAAKKQDLAYSCMVRASVPAGVVSAEQWLVFDRLADEVADGTLRITSRQGLQYHFVAKDDLRTLIGRLNEALLTTLGACGDVVRNVICCPSPHHDRRQDALVPVTQAIARHFRPRTRAYYEVWVDGEQAATVLDGGPDPEEPFYGSTYLPRKFKIAVAWPGDNCVDVYTNDLGVVPVAGRGGEPGHVVLVGGGMGMSHAQEGETYPRLADPLAWVAEADLLPTIEAVVRVQAEYGNRVDRKKARLKYVIEDRGLAWFRAEVERVLARPLALPVPIPAWVDDHGHAGDHLGWHAQPDGRWALGIPVESGRVRDDTAGAGPRLRTALRALVAQYRPVIRLTPRQDVILTGLADGDRAAVEATLAEHGVALVEQISPLRRHALACPALPTCGQALAEAERVLPELVGRFEKLLADVGVAEDGLHLRLTGCPNGCARPYTAEIGIVGRTKTTYDVYVGGAGTGTRLGRRLAVGVPLARLGDELRPALERYRDARLADEGFGDFCHRVGLGRAILRTAV